MCPLDYSLHDRIGNISVLAQVYLLRYLRAYYVVVWRVFVRNNERKARPLSIVSAIPYARMLCYFCTSSR